MASQAPALPEKVSKLAGATYVSFTSWGQGTSRPQTQSAAAKAVVKRKSATRKGVRVRRLAIPRKSALLQVFWTGRSVAVAIWWPLGSHFAQNAGG